MRKLALALCAAAFAAAAGKESKAAPGDAPATQLKRVIVLARHGNRAPNAPIRELCPVYAAHVMPEFGVPPGALSPVGMAENWESGRYLRAKYVDTGFLRGGYSDDGESFFLAERMDRNVVSMQALVQGLYPDGTGYSAYLPTRPNLVPIKTTQAGVDRLMNCPRDGPCRHRYKGDFAKWVRKHQKRVAEDNVELLRNVSEACSYDLDRTHIKYKGKDKPLAWAAKVVADGFSFARNEGLDATVGGTFSDQTINEFKKLAGSMVKATRFGSDEQLTYWLSEFGPTLLELARIDASDEQQHQKLKVFLNHRELVFALAKVLGIPIQFEGYPEDVLPSGSMLLTEVHQDAHGATYLRFKWWMPSQPPVAQKRELLTRGASVLPLYGTGIEAVAVPHACAGQSNGLCPLHAVEKAYFKWVKRTGTIRQLCKLDQSQASAVEGIKPEVFNSGEAETEDVEAQRSFEHGEDNVQVKKDDEADATAMAAPAATSVPAALVLAPVAVAALALLTVRRQRVQAQELLLG